MTSWLLDAGPLVAFFHAEDSYHEWAKEQWAQAPLPLWTCEAVLAEAMYLLHKRARYPSRRVLALIERKIVTLRFSLEENAEPVCRLLAKYSDQQMQLADACLVRMSELKHDCRVFTIDAEEFRIYRRFERQVIPLIAPT